MDTRTYLSQIERLDRMIQNKLSEIKQLQSMVCGIANINEGEKVQASAAKDKISDVVSRIVDMEKEINKMIDKRSEIVRQIESMENTDKYDILAKRYILGTQLKIIAVDTQMSIRQVIRLHSNALQAFEDKYGAEYLEK